jgi:hypothetical protein
LYVPLTGFYDVGCGGGQFLGVGVGVFGFVV